LAECEHVIAQRNFSGVILEKRRLSLLTVLFVVMTSVLATAGLSTNLFRRFFAANSNLYEGIAKGLCILGACYFGLVVFKRLKGNLGTDSPAGPPAPMQPTIEYLYRIQAAAAKHLEDTFTKEGVVTFVSLITTPTRHRSRVVESISLEERVARQEVSVEFSLPAISNSKGGARYVPLFLPLKGQLVDNLKVTDAGGKPLADLSFEESTQLVAAGLRLLLLEALPVPKSRTTSQAPINKTTQQAPNKLTVKARALELLLLEQLARRGGVRQLEAQEHIDRALEDYKTNLTEEGAKELRRYVEALSITYPIVAVVPGDVVADGRVLLRYERTLIPAALNKRGLGWLRVVLGLRPNRVVAPANLSVTAASYHLYLTGPPTMYVLEQEFRCHHCRKRVSRHWKYEKPTATSACVHDSTDNLNSDRFTDDVHYRVAPKRAQNFVHLYTRGFGENKLQFSDTELFAEFKETPPGSRASAVVTAIVATFLIAIMGRLASTGSATPGSLPGLVLALPAAAATWFGFSTDSKSLVGSSMLSRISHITTAIISAVAIAVYFTSHRGHIWLNLGIVGVTEPLWAALLVLSAFNLAYVSYRFVLKVRIYNGLLRKEEGQPVSGAGNMKV
jgi:hypothetical protein